MSDRRRIAARKTEGISRKGTALKVALKPPVAVGGPVGFFDGGNRRDWFPGGRGSEGGFRPL